MWVSGCCCWLSCLSAFSSVAPIVWLLAFAVWRYYPCIHCVSLWLVCRKGQLHTKRTLQNSHSVWMHSVTRTRPIFPVFVFKVIHTVILLTRFCKLLTTVANCLWGARASSAIVNGTTPPLNPLITPRQVASRICCDVMSYVSGMMSRPIDLFRITADYGNFLRAVNTFSFLCGRPSCMEQSTSSSAWRWLLAFV